MTLGPGDLLVLYTDGVVDAIDEAEEEFGQDRLRSRAFRQPREAGSSGRRCGTGCGPGSYYDAPLLDDITLWVLKRSV